MKLFFRDKTKKVDNNADLEEYMILVSLMGF